MAFWLLDRELKRSRPEWRPTFHACLACLPVFLGVLWWKLADAPALPDADELSQAVHAPRRRRCAARRLVAPAGRHAHLPGNAALRGLGGGRPADRSAHGPVEAGRRAAGPAVAGLAHRPVCLPRDRLGRRRRPVGLLPGRLHDHAHRLLHRRPAPRLWPRSRFCCGRCNAYRRDGHGSAGTLARGNFFVYGYVFTVMSRGLFCCPASRRVTAGSADVRGLLAQRLHLPRRGARPAQPHRHRRTLCDLPLGR